MSAHTPGHSGRRWNTFDRKRTPTHVLTTQVTLSDNTASLKIIAGYMRWPNNAPGEILNGAGQPVTLDHHGQVSPPSPDDPPTYIAIGLTDRRTQTGPIGPLTIAVHVVDAEPALDVDAWESIEEAGAHLTGGPPFILDDQGHPIDTLNTALNDHIHDGWYMTRVSVRNLTAPTPEHNSYVQIQMWPIDTPAGLQRISHRPATVPRSKAPTAVDVSTEWRRLMAALYQAGDTRVSARELNFQTKLSPQLQSITEAASNLQIALPRALIEWFSVQAIYPPRHWSQIVPDYDPLTLDEALLIREQLLGAWQPGDHSDTAGDSTYTFIPAYMPIAERDGYLLTVDLREGKKHGQVREFDKVDADDDTTTWRTLPRLLNNLAVAIEYRRPFNNWQPSFETGELRWSPAT